MQINEVISHTKYEAEIRKALMQAFREPLFDKSAYVIDKTNTVLASRNHADEAEPLYIKDNTTLPDRFFNDWLTNQIIEVISNRIAENLKELIIQMTGADHYVYFHQTKKNENGYIVPATNDIVLSEQQFLYKWLHELYLIIDKLLVDEGIVVDDRVVSMQQFLSFLKDNTFIGLSKHNDNCIQELYQGLHGSANTLIHELVHGSQNSAQRKKNPKQRVRYNTYMSKTPLNQLTNDENYDEYYHASPQEIAAKAHNTVFEIMNESKRKDHYNYLNQMILEVKYIINRKQSSGYPIVDYYKETFKPGTKYYFVYKRFIKLVYLEVVSYVESQMNVLSETATAGATSSANIGTVVNPHISPGKARGKKSYTGTPGKSGTKAPSQPTIVQPKTSTGTAVNALDIKGTSVFGGTLIKR